MLLILAAVSIAMLTGDNGILTKASEAEKETDITETKEKIKLELIGTYDENKTNYTNQDVVNAVKKIADKDVAENTATVVSKKGNTIDISDLWIPVTVIYVLPLYYGGDEIEVPYTKGQVWTKEYLLSLPEETEIHQMKILFEEEEAIHWNPDGFSDAYLLLDGKIVKYGDPLIPGGHYRSGYASE